MKSLNPIMMIAYALTGATVGYMASENKRKGGGQPENLVIGSLAGGITGLLAAQLQIFLVKENSNP